MKSIMRLIQFYWKKKTENDSVSKRETQIANHSHALRCVAVFLSKMSQFLVNVFPFCLRYNHRVRW